MFSWPVPSLAMSAANDAHLLALLRLAREHPEPAKAAMSRMTGRASARLAAREEEKRTAARLLPLKLQLARECVLDPSLLTVGPEVFEKDQPGFDSHLVDEGKPIPRWMTRARELGLAVEWESARELGPAIEMMKEARELGIDIERVEPTQCYVLFRRHHAAKSGETEQEIQAAIDPAFVRPVRLAMSYMLFTALQTDLHAAADAPRTEAQWWEASVLLLLFNWPDFDGSAIGLQPPIAWESIPGHPDDGWARCDFLSEIHRRQAAHDDLLARAALCLGELAKGTPKPPKRASAPRSKRTANAKAPRGFVFVKDAEAEFGIADSTINGWADDEANNLRPDKDKVSGLKYVHRATLEALIKKRRPDKG